MFTEVYCVSLVNPEPVFPEFPSGFCVRGIYTRFEKQPLISAGAMLTYNMTERSTGPTGSNLSSLPLPNLHPALFPTVTPAHHLCPRPPPRLWVMDLQKVLKQESH